MTFGFVLYDLLYLTLAAILYGTSLGVGLEVLHALAGRVPSWLAFSLALPAAVLTLIAVCGLATAACPRLEPGRYPMMKGRIFFSWVVRSLIRRVLFVPGLKYVFFASNILRFLSLRALGAEVAFTCSLSTDAELLDPALTTIEGGAMLGARCILAAHYLQEGQLVLDRVRIGAGALLAGEVGVGPGASVGANAIIKARTSLSVGAQVGEGAAIGAACYLDVKSSVGARARLGTGAWVGPHAVVEDDARVEAYARVVA